MTFNINNKVALVSGGASGINFCIVRELLRNGAKAVTLADVNPDFGATALENLAKEFGNGKAIFCLTDVTNFESYKNAFQKTVDTFGNLDIVVNGAGILNDSTWQKEISINVNGIVHGVLLGLDEYIPKYKSGTEGAILNVSSVAGIMGYEVFPIYSGTKFAVIGMTSAWGTPAHYERTNVKILAICPGSTDTPLVHNVPKNVLGPAYQQLATELFKTLYIQKPEFVATSAIQALKNGENGSIWVAEDDQFYQYSLADRQSNARK